MSKLAYTAPPYYDDFDPKKNYKRVLFKAGFPVQTRELNQIQSSFQNQIESFANHFFKNGSKVSNARSSVVKYKFIALEDISPWDNQKNKLEFFREGVKVVCETSGINLTCVMAAADEGIENERADLIYYSQTDTSIAIDGETQNPLDGEVINVYDENDIVIYSAKIRCPTCNNNISGFAEPSNGVGEFYIIDDGIFYFDGLFLSNPRSMIIVNRFSRAGVSCKIGFNIRYDVVTAYEDNSLLDNSLGYPNKVSLGGDRYKVTLTLAKEMSTPNENFIVLLTYENGVVQYIKSDSEYNVIEDELAKRTYEESGNYTVIPSKVYFIEDKAKSVGDPNGRDINGDEDYAVAVTSPLIAYVKGYRREKLANNYTRIKKSRDTRKVSKYIHKFAEKSYIRLKPATWASPYPNSVFSDNILKTSRVDIYSNIIDPNTKLPTGTLIGSCHLVDAEKESGIEGSTAVYKYIITKVSMLGTYKLSAAKSFYNSTNTFAAEAVPDSNNLFTIQNPGNNDLIWRLSKNDVKSVRDIYAPENGSMSFIRRKKIQGTINSSGMCIIEAPANEYFTAVDAYKTVVIISEVNNNTGIHTSIWIGDPTKSRSITSNGTTITIQLESSFAGKTISLIHNVTKTNAKERIKQLTIGTDKFAAANGSILLSKVDVYKIKTIYLIDANGNHQDVSNLYSLDSGQRDHAYTNGSISLLEGKSLPYTINYKLEISYEYFDHIGSGDYYSADSYMGIVNDSSIDFSYGDIPTYITGDKRLMPLAFCLDFRPIIISSIVGGVLVEDIQSTISAPAINSVAVFDIEYYLKRIDYLCIDKDGNMFVEYGLSAESPKPPKVKDDAMPIYRIVFNAYTYSVQDIKTKYIENKRYTMRDIGKLESRIKSIEYYTVLNLIERSAADMKIKDVNGADRFKNGFIADNFEDFQAGDLLSLEFKAAINKRERELRPGFTSRSSKLKFNQSSSTEYIKKSDMVMMPYINELAEEQPYATKHLSVNPYFMFTRTGKMSLSPNNDSWVDTTRLPALEVDIDTGTAAFESAGRMAGVLGTQWGEWSTLNQSVLSDGLVNARDGIIAGRAASDSNNAVESKFAPALVPPLTPPGFVDTAAVRIGTRRTAGTENTTYNFGERILDVQLLAYMRSTEIEFSCSGLAPNLKVYAYFRDTAVSEHCKPFDAVGGYGQQLITDANGSLRGVFRIPEGRFFSGHNEFKISGDPKNTGDPDLTICEAKAKYYAGGIDVTKQNSDMNVVTPTLETIDLIETRVTRASLPPPAPRGAPRDPVAQSFKFLEDRFVTGLDLFFESSDMNSKGIWVELRPMVNGYPTQDKLGSKQFTPQEVLAACSKDSSIPLHVEFDFPIFVKGGGEYCFVVGGSSPETRIWVAKLGGEVVNMPGKIVETQPSLGSSFRSQNGTAWNAEQYEDIKYRLYVAKFEKDVMTVEFNQINERERLLLVDPIECEAGLTTLRVYHKNHGMHAGDKFNLFIEPDEYYRVQIASGKLIIGHTITTSTGSATIDDVEVFNLSTNEFNIKLKNVVGAINMAAAFTCNILTLNPKDPYVSASLHIDSNSITIAGVSGTIIGTPTVESGRGVSYQDLNKTHTVIQANSLDSYTFSVSGISPSSTGRFGGHEVFVESNYKYDLCNISGAYLKYGSTDEWTFGGIYHNQYNGTNSLAGPFPDDDYTYSKAERFNFGEDIVLDKPLKIMNNLMEADKAAKSVRIRGTITTPNRYISPVFNDSTFSIIHVSNHIEKIEESLFNTSPNAAMRYKTELSPTDGSEGFKYVTKSILLKNPASDLYIMFDAFKDYMGEMEVYYKTLMPYDSRLIDEVEWIKVPILFDYHSEDINDRKDYEIILSEVMGVNWSAEQFSTFKVKIVGKSLNSSKPPTFKSLRVIAFT